jgi:hypothetical protein|uniref:Uncharacterized protein n=1 Tax=Populus trichocarpa TaxID=3694 RepID=A0A2K1Y6J3_POPTR
MDAPVQQRPKILFAIFSVGKEEEEAQNSLKAWSAISVQNSPCHNQQVCDLSRVNFRLLKILNSKKKKNPIELSLKSPKCTLITPHLTSPDREKKWSSRNQKS